MKTNRFYVKIKLVVTSTNLVNGDKYILSIHPLNIELPFIYWTTDNRAELTQLFKRYLDLDINWANPKIKLATMIDGDMIELSYSCVIPYDSKLKEAYWIEISKISSLQILTILGKQSDELY